MVECDSVRQPRKFGACAEIFDRDHRGTGPGGLCAGLGPTAGDIASEIKVADREYEEEDDEQVFDGIDGVLDMPTRYRMDYGPVSVFESGIGAV